MEKWVMLSWNVCKGEYVGERDVGVEGVKSKRQNKKREEKKRKYGKVLSVTW